MWSDHTLELPTADAGYLSSSTHFFCALCGPAIFQNQLECRRILEEDTFLPRNLFHHYWPDADIRRVILVIIAFANSLRHHYYQDHNDHDHHHHHRDHQDSKQAWKLGPALATGNTVVMKLAEQTPLRSEK